MTNKLVVIINSLKVPKIKKILLYEMKFLVPNYSCLQIRGVTIPRSPFSLSSVLNWICWTSLKKFLGTPLNIFNNVNLQLYIIEYIVVFWLNNILVSATTLRDGSYKIFNTLALITSFTNILTKVQQVQTLTWLINLLMNSAVRQLILWKIRLKAGRNSNGLYFVQSSAKFVHTCATVCSQAHCRTCTEDE